MSINNVMIVADKHLAILSRELHMILALAKSKSNLLRREFAAEESGKENSASIFSNCPNKLRWISPDSFVNWVRLANIDIAFIGIDGMR